LDHKKEDGKVLFLIQWEGFTEEFNSWEPLENLTGCLEYINSYLYQHLN